LTRRTENVSAEGATAGLPGSVRRARGANGFAGACLDAALAEPVAPDGTSGAWRTTGGEEGDRSMFSADAALAKNLFAPKNGPAPGRFSLVLGILAAGAILLTGCGRGGPEVVRVTGTVTCQGKPVANLFLNFKPEVGRPSWGVTDAEGKYSLNYSRDRDGAVVGKHTVWVQYKPGSPTEELQMTGGRGAKRPGNLSAIVQKYGSEKTTPLKFDIETDGQVVDIALD
jgi:hypothetical protein